MNIIQQKLETLKQQEVKLLKQLDTQRSNKKFVCVCGKRHKIKDCEILQSYYYHPPHGCTEGDYYSESDMYIPCPDVKVLNRLLFTSVWTIVPWEKRKHYDYDVERQFSRLYKKLFKNSRDITDDDKQQPWKNNEHVAKNYKFYDLHIGEEKD